MNRIPLPHVHLNRVVIGTVLLPMILGGLILWSLSDRAERSDRVPTAVVNADKIVYRHGKPIYAGRLLAAELTSPREKDRNSLGWELTDAQDAQEGLRNGDYYAVLTIPQDFSRKIAGLQGEDPETAGITVRTNDSSSALVGEISRQVGDIAANRLGHRITATFVKGFLSQSGVLKEQLGEAASGAGRLADGDYRLADGADQLGDGARKLQHGLGRLATGADRLSAGADRLSTGADKMAAGADKLGDGIHRAGAGQDRLAGGLTKLSRSAHRASGPAPPPDPASMRRLQHQMQSAAALVQQLHRACQAPAFRAGARDLCRSAETATLSSDSAGQLRAMGAFAAAWPRFVHALDRSAAGARRLATGMDRLEGGARQLSTGASRLSAGADRLSAGADELSDGAHQAQDGAGKLAAGAYRLSDGADRLGDGSGKLASGLQKGADKIPAPDDPAHQARVLSDPVDAASDDVNPVLDGATLLTPGALALALWLGAFVIYLARRGVPERLRSAALSPAQLAWAGWWPALVLAGVQTALLLAVPWTFGAHLASPWGVIGVSLFAAAVFTAINQALVTWLGAPRGWIVSIVFAGLQVVSLGGLLPIDTAPGVIQALNEVLPIARAADALSRLTLGGSVGNVAVDLLVLGVWGVAALVATVIAARRQQGTTVAEVRRELAPAA